MSQKAQTGGKIQGRQDLAYIIRGQTWCQCAEAKLTETSEMCPMLYSFLYGSGRIPHCAAVALKSAKTSGPVCLPFYSDHPVSLKQSLKTA